MTAFNVIHRLLVTAIVAALVASGCGEYVRQGRSPAQLVIVRLETPAVELVKLEGGTGVPGKLERVSGFGPAPLYSNIGEVTHDAGRAVLRQVLRDPGATGATAAPTPLNDITVTEYEVRYRLANGRNTPGVDVPYPIRGGLTFTIQGSGNATAEFELVRRVAKLEAPLAVLKGSKVVLTVIADVTFYGRDQAGNAASATGSVQINFLDFAG